MTTTTAMVAENSRTSEPPKQVTTDLAVLPGRITIGQLSRCCPDGGGKSEKIKPQATSTAT